MRPTKDFIKYEVKCFKASFITLPREHVLVLTQQCAVTCQLYAKVIYVGHVDSPGLKMNAEDVICFFFR
ncbi:hypothetical protein TSMEX_004357 [Taenia solium]|eukprot:TsM_000919200 transcript=TsM_000919200 gene=TsM_000919200